MEADMDLTNMAMDIDRGRHSRYAGDDHLLLQFFMQPIPNDEKSAKEGRPIFDDVEMIRIMVPGDKDSMICRPIHPDDKQRFSRQYQSWKANNDGDVIEGTPLSEWPVITRAQVEELKFFNVRTVEQLANISDAHSQKFMGIQMLKQRAKDFLEAAGGAAIGTELRRELEAKDAELEVLKQAVESLTAKVEALSVESEDED
jgi:hypothetical protein